MQKSHSVLDRPWLLFALACGALISAGIVVPTIYGGGLGFDFSILWKAAQAQQPYTPDPYGPFAYPPTALLWLKPFGLLPLWWSFALWTLLSVSAFYAVTSRQALFVSPIVMQGLTFGQPTLLLGSLVLCSPRFRGFAIGLVLSIKPQLLFLAPLVFAARRDWKTTCEIGVGAFYSVAISIGVFGMAPWINWVHSLPHLRDVMVHRNLWWMTITPYGTAARFGLDPLPFWAAGAALALVLAIRSKADPLFVSALASVLATPYAYAQDLVVLLPFCLAKIERRPFSALIFAGALIPLALVGTAFMELLRHDEREANPIPLDTGSGERLGFRLG